MFGFLIFYNIYLNLSCEGKNKILGNVFGVGDVSITDFIIKNDRVIIRMFSKNVFYQYVFEFDEGICNIIFDDRIVKGKIFVLDESCREFNFFIYSLARCSLEGEVYRLIQEFL